MDRSGGPGDCPLGHVLSQACVFAQPYFSGATGRGPALALARDSVVFLVLLGFPCFFFGFTLFFFAFLCISESVVLYEWFS